MPGLVYKMRENGLVKRWNCTLKGVIQAFMGLDRLWEEGMTDLLAQHRHMPSSPQGKAPATLLLGRNTWMSFELPPKATWPLGGTLSGTGMPTMGKVPRGAGPMVDPSGVTGVGGTDWSRL